MCTDDAPPLFETDPCLTLAPNASFSLTQKFEIYDCEVLVERGYLKSSDDAIKAFA
jgi:hypothetical protein